MRSVSSIYKSTLEELGPELEPKERNLLHVVYERLRVGDERLENFERDIRRDLAEDLVADPFAAHAGLLRDLIQSYNVVSNLLKSYLEGRPEDVFPISKVLASPGA